MVVWRYLDRWLTLRLLATSPTPLYSLNNGKVGSYTVKLLMDRSAADQGGKSSKTLGLRRQAGAGCRPDWPRLPGKS